ncbi:YadA-like family protein, partial [Rodentibacter pneumotropicus]
IVKDGATGAKGDTGADGKNAEADVKDNGDGTHTITIKDGNGNTTTSIVKDGKDAKATVTTDTANGTQTITITDGSGNTTTATVKDGHHFVKTEKSQDNISGQPNDKGSKVNTGDNVTFVAAKNLEIAQDGNKVAYGLSDQVELGQKGEPGKDGQSGKDGVDGSIGVNGKDGSAVAINGKDGSIGLNGKDGKDGLTFKSADGAQGVNGEDGKDGLPGANSTTRIVYQPTNPDGSSKGDSEQVATLNDGLIFTGNNEELNRHKLNTVVKVLGEGVDKAASEKFKSAKGNINVKADGTDKLEVQMNKDLDLTSNGSVTIGNTVINNGTVSGLNDHLKDPVTASTSNVTNATQTAPADLSFDEKKQAATVGDVLNIGWNLKANGQAVGAVTHGKAVDLTSKNGTVTIKPTTDGNISTVDLAVNTGNVSADKTTGKAVVGKDGKADISPDAANEVATVGDVADTINNTGWATTARDRDGNTANVVVNPGDQVNYTNGTGTTANITVTTDPVTGKDTVNVSYDVKAGDNTITVDKDGVKVNTGNITKAGNQYVKDSAGNVVIPAGQVSVKGTPVGNETQADADAREGNKVATVKNVADAINSAGWIVNTGKAEEQSSFTTEAGTAQKVSAGDKVDFQAGKNVEVKQIIGEDGSVKIVYATSDNFSLGEKGKDGKDGVDGSTSVNGKDGSAVVINGKDGSIGLNGKDGENGLTIKGGKGSVGVDGTDGKDGKDGMTRIVYTDDKGTKHEIATHDDGLKFTGNDNDTVNNHKLNSVVTVKGEGVDKAVSKSFKSASGNINVKADGQGTLEVQLAKDIDLGNDGSVRAGNTVINNRGISVKNGPSMTVDGINAGNKKITNVVPGEVSATSTEAVNGSQLYAVNRNISNNVNRLNNKINKVDKDLRAGIAGAAAIAGLPQVRGNGKSMVAVAASNYRGENAVALGYTRASDNGKVLLKLSGSTNTRGDVVSTVGLGYEW